MAKAKGQHPTRRRIAPEQAPVTDDTFVAKVFELSTWAKKNSQLLILAGVALVLLVGGAIYYASYRRDVDQQAIQTLEAVQQVVAFGLPEEAEVRLTEFLQRFGGTRHATEARLMLGQLHLKQNRTEQAIAVLEEAKGSADEAMGVQVRMLLGRAYEAADRLPDAEQEYMGVASAADMEFQQRDALASAARVRTLQGNHAGAAEIYRQILSELEEADPERGLYEMRLSEAEYALAA
jgi:predicted negative regulator of RcsB-dependent stress response